MRSNRDLDASAGKNLPSFEGGMWRIGSIRCVLDDYNITNTMVVDDRIMLIDLEKYYDIEPEELERFSGFSIDGVCNRYAVYLDNVERYGEP